MEITVPVLPDSFEKIYETLVRLLNGILSSTCGTAEMEKRLLKQELYLLLLKFVSARVCVCVCVCVCFGALVTNVLFKRYPRQFLSHSKKCFFKTKLLVSVGKLQCIKFVFREQLLKG